MVFESFAKFINRLLQVLICNGSIMTDEEIEETQEVEKHENAELTLEERQEKLKKTRWNVFMYLGLAALFFGFALYPFMGFAMTVDEGIGSTDFPLQVWGIPVAGEDFTDIPVEIEVVVQSLPSDVNTIQVFIIENPKMCDATDGSIEMMRNDLLTGEAEHPNTMQTIENPVESKTYDLEFSIDPGLYCVQLVVNTDSQNFAGTNVQADVDIYPTQIPLAAVGMVCLLLSGFAFIGAQKEGKYVKSLTEPKDMPTIEDQILSSAGPTGPPTGRQVHHQVQPAHHQVQPVLQLAQPAHLHPQPKWLRNHHRFIRKMCMRPTVMDGISENSQMVLTTKPCICYMKDNTSRTSQQSENIYTMLYQTYLPLKED